MSGRTVPRIALAGLLIAAFAANASAQEGGFQVPLNAEPVIPIPVPPEAPMPRAVAQVPDLNQVLQQIERQRYSGFGLPPYVQRLLRDAEIARQKNEAYVQGLSSAYPLFRDAEIARQKDGAWRSCAPNAKVPATYPTHPPAPVAPSMVPSEPLVVVGQNAVPDDCEMADEVIGKVDCCDVTRFFFPAPVQLDGVVSTCGTFRHPPQPAPLHFLLMKCDAITAAQFMNFNGGPVGGTEPQPLVVSWSPLGIEPVANTPTAPSASAPPVNPLIGTWYRDVGVGLLVATFTPDEMKLSVTPRADDREDKPYTITVTAHYTLTKDGLLYGAVTGADLESKVGLDKEDRDLLEVVQGLTDRPFSFRVKQTSAGMMASNLKLSTMGPDDKETPMQLFAGLYKCARDGKVPVAARPQSNSGASTPGSSAPLPGLPGAAAQAEPKSDNRIRLMPPIRTGEPAPICEEVPSDAEILRALPRVAGAPGLFTCFRDNIVIVKNRLVDKIDAPRFFPLVGQAQLHHCHWECVVYYDELVQSDYPFPVSLKKPRTQVIYIDKDFLHLYVGPNPDAKQPGAAPGATTSPAIGSATHSPLVGAAIGGLGGAATGALLGNPGEGTGAAPNTPIPLMSQPLPPYPVPPPPSVPQSLPAAPPVSPVGSGGPFDSMKLMAGEVFGQMLQQIDAVRPSSGMTLPSPRYLEHFPQYFAPEPTLPLPRELASREAPGCSGAPAPASTQPKPGIVGTWYREIGGKQSVVKIAPDHLTVTITESHELDDTTITVSTILTIDYQFMRDGVTALGLIANADLKIDGDLSEDRADEVKDDLVELQKGLGDKPVAMTIRLYGDVLVLGNVRLPALGNADLDPAPFIGGRYTNAGTKPLPKPKTIKAPVPLPLPPANAPLPHSAVNEHPATPGTAPRPHADWTPAAPPSGSSLPVPETVPQMPQPAERSGAQQEFPSVTNEPVQPVPPMSQPTAPKEESASSMSEYMLFFDGPLQSAPPKKSKARKPVAATQIAVEWRKSIDDKPDPNRNGAMVPGLTGQLFMFGGPRLEFADPDGTLTVDLIDETPRPAGQPAATPERWQFDKEMLRNLRTSNETWGKSYVLFLPWPAYKSDITKVKISVRYDPDNGPYPLFVPPTIVTIGVTAAPSESTTKAESRGKAPTVPFSSPKEEWVPPTKEPAEPAPGVPFETPIVETRRLPAGSSTQSSGADVYPMNARTIKLPIEYKKDKKTIRRALLYVSRNRENTWFQEAAVTPDTDFFVFTAKEDGEYWFKMVIEFTNGAKDPPDVTRDPPDLKIAVVTTPPVVRVTNARRSGEDVVIEWAVDGKFGNDDKTKVHFRKAGAPEVGWQQVIPPTNSPNGVRFPCGTTDAIVVKITAADMAGNRAEVTKEFPAIGAAEAPTVPFSSWSVPVADQTTNATPPAKPGLVGTWYREIGPMMCVIKIEADHLTVTASVLDVADDKEVKAGGIITADYHLARNGTTVVGLITGFDWLIEGDVSKGTDTIESLTRASTDKIQKHFVDHPYAFNVRVYGDTLMISNVKAPISGDDETVVALFAGRYKNAGDKPVPKPKAVESRKDSFGGLTLPSARDLERFPQGFSSEPAAPNTTTASGTSSTPAAPPVGDNLRATGGDPPILPPPPPATPEQVTPSMTEPPPPGDVVPAVPQMPQPTPPELDVPSTGRAPAVPTKAQDKLSLFGSKGKDSSNPATPIRKLVYKSPKGPKYDVYETIHGGVCP